MGGLTGRKEPITEPSIVFIVGILGIEETKSEIVFVVDGCFFSQTFSRVYPAVQTQYRVYQGMTPQWGTAD